MIVELQIKGSELALIEAGTKRNEWRQVSRYNIEKLLVDRGDGKKVGNPQITHIRFVNGFAKERRTLTVEVRSIMPFVFQNDVEIPADNFRALKGMKAIRIELGERVPAEITADM